MLTSAGNLPRTVKVLLDGKPITARDAGADVRPGGLVTVRGQRLYSLVSAPADVTATITLADPAGGQRLRLHVRLGRDAL